MFDLSDVPDAVDAAARYLRRRLGLTRGPADASGGPRAPGVGAAGRCFKDIEPGRPIPFDCVEFYRPDGKLIWEEGVNADV